MPQCVVTAGNNSPWHKLGTSLILPRVNKSQSVPDTLGWTQERELLTASTSSHPSFCPSFTFTTGKARMYFKLLQGCSQKSISCYSQVHLTQTAANVVLEVAPELSHPLQEQSKSVLEKASLYGWSVLGL